MKLSDTLMRIARKSAGLPVDDTVSGPVDIDEMAAEAAEEWTKNFRNAMHQPPWSLSVNQQKWMNGDQTVYLTRDEVYDLQMHGVDVKTYRGLAISDDKWGQMVNGVARTEPSDLEKAAKEWEDGLHRAAGDEEMGPHGINQEWGSPMSDATKKRILRDAGVRGVVPPPSANRWVGGSGETWDSSLSITGSNSGRYPVFPAHHSYRQPIDEIDVDALWEKMYIKFKKVIVICPWCKAPQAINDGTCIHCGGVLEMP